MTDRFIPEKLDRAWRLLERFVEEDRFPAIAAVVGSSHDMTEPHVWGRLRLVEDSPPIDADTIFLIASPTKPITAIGVMLLVERGLIALNDAVVDFVPEFAASGKRNIKLIHLLTHTSGLPDMVPDNAELRAAEAPIEEFLRRAYALRGEFQPGRNVQYQSTGFLMLGEIVRRVTGEPLAAWLKQHVFAPLGMHDTALGMPPEWERPTPDGTSPRRERIADVRHDNTLPDATWNTDYWHRFGAPWGGLLSTPADLGRLCKHLLSIHRGESGILSRATLTAMTTNRLDWLPELPEPHRRAKPWGYGWRLNWPGEATSFGDLLSPRAYGHWGATGTLVWLDPEQDAFAVALSPQPLDADGYALSRFSNAVCAALGTQNGTGLIIDKAGRVR